MISIFYISLSYYNFLFFFAAFYFNTLSYKESTYSVKHGSTFEFYSELFRYSGKLRLFFSSSEYDFISSNCYPYYGIVFSFWVESPPSECWTRKCSSDYWLSLGKMNYLTNIDFYSSISIFKVLFFYSLVLMINLFSSSS